MGRKKDGDSLGRLLCKILRHEPEIIGITLDEHGWAEVSELQRGLKSAKGIDITQEQLERIVAEDGKQRYAFDADHRRIRCSQGHSIEVDVQPQRLAPPEILFHGTSVGAVASIEREGIQRMTRLYVQLSKDVETAWKVGRRHGKPVLYQVDAGRMAADGYEFFLSENDVWMTRAVPPAYIHRMEENAGRLR